MDSFSGHFVKSELSNVIVEFFPKNCTSVLQPLDQGIIKSFKGQYRSKMLKTIITMLDRVETVEDITLLDALYYVKSAWYLVTAKTIQNCFSSAGFNKLTISFPLEDDLNVDEVASIYCRLRNIESFDFNKYACVDNNENVCANLTDLEIVQNAVIVDEDVNVEEAVESQETIVSTIIDLKTALNHIHELKCLLNHLNYDLDSILTIEDFLICERFNHVKQLTIHDYFKR